MTPSFMGLMATMLPGVRPSISLASLPTASTSPVFLLMATMEGSLTTMPLPRAYPVASVRMGGRVHNSMGRTPFCRQTKVPVPQEFVPQGGAGSLDHDLFLHRVHPALGILRRNRDQALARRKWRHKVVKAAVGANHRHFSAIDHHPRPNFGLSGQLDHVTMLHEGIQLQIDGGRVLALGNDSEPVLLALHRFLIFGVVGLN